MRRLSVVLLLCTLALGGCHGTGEVENQAYVLVLGVDRLPDGQLGLTARAPKIGSQDAGNGETGGGGSPYLTFTAAGKDWAAALDALERVTPRQTNLSHIVMVVASEALAAEADFANLVNAIVETPHLYGNAWFAVCEGGAGDFARAGETVIGTRMSSELNAMMAHYAAQGIIPRSTLADVYFAVNGIYGDPVAIHARLDGDADSPQSQRFLGAALFRNGAFIRSLDARETRLLNLIRGESASFPFDANGKSCQLTPEGVKKRVDTNGNVSVEVRLSTVDDVSAEELSRFEQALEVEIATLIHDCQAIGTEPFGLAEIAAARFTTVDDWLAYNWRERFARAGIEIKVSVYRVGGK